MGHGNGLYDEQVWWSTILNNI